MLPPWRRRVIGFESDANASRCAPVADKLTIFEADLLTAYVEGEQLALEVSTEGQRLRVALCSQDAEDLADAVRRAFGTPYRSRRRRGQHG